MLIMTPAAMRGQLMALAFVHPMFIWLALGAVLSTGWDLPANTSASSLRD
ncbi:hypothetical protein [Burkholderia ubonensis]|nr:hypothetical protein [Burkholderia ubonensis]